MTNIIETLIQKNRKLREEKEKLTKELETWKNKSSTEGKIITKEEINQVVSFFEEPDEEIVEMLIDYCIDLNDIRRAFIINSYKVSSSRRDFQRDLSALRDELENVS